MLEVGDLFEDKYRIQSYAGKGGMGTVYVAEDINTGRVWAIKEAVVTEYNKKLVYSEAQIMSKLNNKSMPAVKEIIQEGDLLYIVMEYVQGDTLESYLRNGSAFAENIIHKWFIEICDVLIYLHELDPPIVYRDLKPSNIMVEDDGNIKIIDFGIAQEYSENGKIDQQTMALTKGYAAPEQYDARFRYDVRTDIYALGVTMHYLLTGKNPNKPPYHFDKVRKLAPNVSLALEFIVAKCLQPNPDKRYKNARELKKDLVEAARLEKQLKKKRRINYAVVSAVFVAAIGLAIGIYSMVRVSNTKQLEEYYRCVEAAHSQIESGEYEEAVKNIEKAIDKEPALEDAYIMMIRFYMSRDEYDKVREYVKDEILPRFSNIYENPDFLLVMGDYYLELGDSENSEFYYSEYDRYKYNQN